MALGGLFHILEMKQLLLTLLIPLILTACGGNAPATAEATASDSSFHIRAKALMDDRAHFDSILAMQERAVDELRRGRSTDNPVDVLQQMGYLYCRAGRYDLGADFLLEAVDSLDRREPQGAERETAARLFGNLANLYVRMNMFDEALDANARALTYSRGIRDIIAGNLWRMRSNIFDEMNAPADSVLHCYDMALTKIEGNPRLALSIAAERGDYIIMRSDSFPRDKVRRTLDMMESTDFSPSPFHIATYVSIGQGRLLFGDTATAISLFEKALDASRQRQDIEMIQYAEKYLLSAYAKTGRSRDLAALFPEYDALCDTLLDRDKINSVTASEFRFRTKKKDLEAQMWKERSADALKIIVLQWLAIGLAVALASILIFRILRKLSHARRSREEMHRRLMTMLERQKEVNATIETLNANIAELNNEIENRHDSETINSLLAAMPSSLLSDSQEAEFRRGFSQIYPRFIPQLHRDYPAVTPNDELIAMLIYMKYSTEEIALSLGIGRQSVNSARYRLRKKLNLDKETDLDTFLRSRKG